MASADADGRGMGLDWTSEAETVELRMCLRRTITQASVHSLDR